VVASARPLSVRLDRFFQSVEIEDHGVGTPAFPFEIIRDVLQQIGFRDGMIRILEHREDFREL
jgi:hypothetical protein